MLELERLVVRLMMDASQYDRMISSMERTTMAAAKKMMSWGTRLALAFTLPLLGIGATAVTAFASFDKAMTNSVSIMRNVTPQMRKEMEALALTLSGESTKSATELATSYYFLASAGMNVQQAMAAMPVMTRFAAAGAFDMAKATDLLTDALTASGWALDETGENLSKLGDHIVMASVQANMSVEQFATSLTSDAGVAARNFGMEIETTMALLGAYASSGLKAEEAGTSFGRAIRLLTSAHRANGDAFKVYGVDVVDEATGKYRNFIDIIADLEKSVGKMPPAMRDAALETMGFESLSQKAILPLIGMSEQMKIWEAEQRKAAGTMQNVSNEQLKAFSNQLTITKNKLTNISIEIGGRLAPYLLQLNQMIGRATLMWGSLSDSTKNQIVLYATIAAAVGPLLLGFGMLLKFVAMGIGVVGLIFRPLILGMSLITRGFVQGSSTASSSFARMSAAGSSAAGVIRSSFSAAIAAVISSVGRTRAMASQVGAAYRTGYGVASLAVKGFAVNAIKTGILIRNTLDPAYLKATWADLRRVTMTTFKGMQVSALRTWQTIKTTFTPAYMKAVFVSWGASASAAFQSMKVKGIATARLLRVNFMTVMGRAGGAMGGIAMAGGMLGAMGIGGAFAPILAGAPMAIMLISSLAGAVGSLLSPFLLLAGVVGVGAYLWANYTDSGQEALSSLNRGLEDYRAIGSQTFAGVKAALMAGDLSSAGAIAFAGLKAIWFTGVADLMENWGGFINNIVSSFAAGIVTVTHLWSDMFNKIETIIIDLASQEGIKGDAARKMLGFDPREMQNVMDNAEKIAAAFSGKAVKTTNVGDLMKNDLAKSAEEYKKMIATTMDTLSYSFKQMSDPASLREQATAAQKSIGTLTGLIGKQKEAAEQSASLAARVDELNSSLQQQVLTFGMDSTEAEIFGLEMAKVEPEMLAQAKALQGMLKEKEKLQQMEQDAASIIDKNMTPMERYTKTIEELGKMNQTVGKDGNLLLDSMQYGRAMDAANKELEEAQQKAGEGIIAKFSVDTSGLKNAQTAMDQLRFLQALDMKIERPQDVFDTLPSLGLGMPSVASMPSLPVDMPDAFSLMDNVPSLDQGRDMMADLTPETREFQGWTPDQISAMSPKIDSPVTEFQGWTPDQITAMSSPVDPISVALESPLDVLPMVDVLISIDDHLIALVDNTNPDNAEEPIVLKPLGLRG